MANLTITIPDGDVLDTLVEAADAYLDANQIPRVGLTKAARGKLYIAGVLRDVYVRRKRASAETTVQGTVTNAVTTAQTDAQGIV